MRGGGGEVARMEGWREHGGTADGYGQRSAVSTSIGRETDGGDVWTTDN